MDQMKTKPKGRSAKKSVKTKGNENRKPKNDRKIEKDKKQKYSTYSSQTVLKDMKNSAMSGINSFRTTFGTISNVRSF